MKKTRQEKWEIYIMSCKKILEQKFLRKEYYYKLPRL